MKVSAKQKMTNKNKTNFCIKNAAGGPAARLPPRGQASAARPVNAALASPSTGSKRPPQHTGPDEAGRFAASAGRLLGQRNSQAVAGPGGRPQAAPKVAAIPPAAHSAASGPDAADPRSRARRGAAAAPLANRHRAYRGTRIMHRTYNFTAPGRPGPRRKPAAATAMDWP